MTACCELSTGYVLVRDGVSGWAAGVYGWWWLGAMLLLLVCAPGQCFGILGSVLIHRVCLLGCLHIYVLVGVMSRVLHSCKAVL